MPRVRRTQAVGKRTRGRGGAPRVRKADDLGTRVGQRVRELRTQAGLTLEQVAEFSAADADDETAPRLSKGHLSDVENGYARPTIATIQRLALALDVDLLDLLTFAEASPRQRLVEETRRLPQEAIDRLLRAAKKLSR